MAPEAHDAFAARKAVLRSNTTDMGPERWIDVDGILTRYFELGPASGTPLVFLHGGGCGAPTGGSSARIWELNFVPLSSRRNVISIDRLGQGYTGLPKSDAEYTMHASVQHTAAFLRAIDRAPYHLIGHSRGGYVVCRLALEYPDLVQSCVIVASGTLLPGIEANRIWMAHPPLPKGTRESQRWIYERYSYNPRIVTEAWLDEAEAAGKTSNARIAVRKMVEEGLERSLFSPELGRQRAETQQWVLDRGLQCPTLTIWGYNDGSVSLDNGKLLTEMLMRHQPDTEMRVFNRSGHFVYREHPEAFNGMLIDFVTAYDPH